MLKFPRPLTSSVFKFARSVTASVLKFVRSVTASVSKFARLVTSSVLKLEIDFTSTFLASPDKSSSSRPSNAASNTYNPSSLVFVILRIAGCEHALYAARISSSVILPAFMLNCANFVLRSIRQFDVNELRRKVEHFTLSRTSAVESCLLFKKSICLAFVSIMLAVFSCGDCANDNPSLSALSITQCST